MKKAHLSLPGFLLAFTACNGPVVSIPGPSPGPPPSQGLPRDETIQGLEVQATINANLGILTLLTEDLKTPAGYGVVNNGRAYLQLKSTLPTEWMSGKLQEELQQQAQQTCPAGQITLNTLHYTGEFQAAKIRPFLLPDIRVGGHTYQNTVHFVYATRPASLRGEWQCSKPVAAGGIETITYDVQLKAGWNLLEVQHLQGGQSKKIHWQGQSIDTSQVVLTKS